MILQVITSLSGAPHRVGESVAATWLVTVIHWQVWQYVSLHWRAEINAAPSGRPP